MPHRQTSMAFTKVLYKLKNCTRGEVCVCVCLTQMNILALETITSRIFPHTIWPLQRPAFLFCLVFVFQTDLNSSCGFVLLTNYFVSFSYLKNKSYVKVKWEEMSEALVLRIRGSFYYNEFGEIGSEFGEIVSYQKFSSCPYFLGLLYVCKALFYPQCWLLCSSSRTQFLPEMFELGKMVDFFFLPNFHSY